MSNGKVIIIHLIAGRIKKALHKKDQYFCQSWSFQLCNKKRFKKATGIDTSNLASKLSLAKLKAEIDEIDVGKLKTVLVDLSKLSNVVNNEVVMKTVYDKLVAEVNDINTSGFVLKTKNDRDKSDLEKKLVTQTKKVLIMVDLLKIQIIMLKLLK